MCLGSVSPFLTAWLVRRSFNLGNDRPLVIALPLYQCPSIRSICSESIQRTLNFVRRSGQIIVPLCALLTLMSHVNFLGHWVDQDLSQSLLGQIGRAGVFLFKPMGIDADNWPAVIALLSGVLAKEVVIGVLNTLYVTSQPSPLLLSNIWMLCKAMFASIQAQSFAFFSWICHPWEKLLHSGGLNPSVGDRLIQNFQTPAAAYAYLVFILLYVPCVSTIAAIDKELTRFWACFALFWSIGIAYALATVCYQISILSVQNLSSASILFEVCAVFWIVQYALKYYLDKHPKHFLLRVK